MSTNTMRMYGNVMQRKLCYPGLLAKFKQNRHLANMLLSTGASHLAEASYDKIWGTGIPLKEQDCLNTSNWSGTGILGEMLMDVQHDLLIPTEISMETNDTNIPNEPVNSEVPTIPLPQFSPNALENAE